LGYGRIGDVEHAKAVLGGMSDGQGMYLSSDNTQLYPVRQLEYFKNKLKVQSSEGLSNEEKQAKAKEIDAQLAELDILVKHK
jgi:phosphonate transport system substrate-binding protein